MTPLVFSGNRGWLHSPAGNGPLREGIVFFSAYGVEDLATRHSLSRLAAQLSDTGHPVLRFDLPGTGDSLGNWDDAASLPAWVEAGQKAVDVLLCLSGGTSVSLLGLRLGGLIASLVAGKLQTKGQTVGSMALLAPILDGRQHMREWRTLSNSTIPLTIAGFPINEELRQAITAITPEQFVSTPAQRVFLAAPGTAKYLSEIESEWRKHTLVTSVPYPGLAEHIGNPTMSRPPAEMFERLREWFGEDQLTAQEIEENRFAKTLRTPGQATLASNNFVEEGEVLDIENGLAGIWCSPNLQTAKTIVVFCNAGRNPHTGWARSSVTEARRLAEHGIASLRFDLTGFGDSPPMSEQPLELLYCKAGIPQLKAVVDTIEKRHGPDTKICLVGACSGGYLAFHEAINDTRISGLVLVNVQRFIWQEGTSLQASMRATGKSTRAYRQQAISLETWKRLIGGKIDVATISRTLMQRGWNGAIQIVSHQGKRLQRFLMNALGDSAALLQDSKSIISQGFAALTARGTKTVVIYGEDDGGRDEFARYFDTDSYRFTQQPGARLVIIPDTDHDLTPIPAREQLFAEILAVCISPESMHP
jgi:pimeloyl-ACP methyl ester carboxylesterase